MDENTLAAVAERDMAKDAEIERLRAELEQFKPQPMSQRCRDGHHAGTGDERCIGCRCLCHATDARWQALKDYLGQKIDADHAVHRGFLADGDLTTAAPFGGLLSANRSTLAKMRELEEER